MYLFLFFLVPICTRAAGRLRSTIISNLKEGVPCAQKRLPLPIVERGTLLFIFTLLWVVDRLKLSPPLFPDSVFSFSDQSTTQKIFPKGGASTQIIFRHNEAQQQPQQQQDQQEELDANENSEKRHFFVATGIHDGGADTEAFSLDGEGGDDVFRSPTGASDVPVSQDDFWGMSHLGYGVMEVR